MSAPRRTSMTPGIGEADTASGGPPAADAGVAGDMPPGTATAVLTGDTVPAATDWAWAWAWAGGDETDWASAFGLPVSQAASAHSSSTRVAAPAGIRRFMRLPSIARSRRDDRGAAVPAAADQPCRRLAARV